MNEKVKLPPEVAEAIENAGMTHKEIFEFIAIREYGVTSTLTANFKIIYYYYLKHPYELTKALIIGYEVEEEDIIPPPITPKKQSQLREHYKNLLLVNLSKAYHMADLLNDLNITIKGINDTEGVIDDE